MWSLGKSVRVLARNRNTTGYPIVSFERYFCDDQKCGLSPKAKLKIKAVDSAGSTREIIHGESEYQQHLREENEINAKKVAQKNAQQGAIFATKLGAAANVSLSLAKGVVGYTIASTALMADAANSLGDIFGDAVVYYSVTEARKRATPDRPWGRGKIEPLGALSVGALLCFTGFGIGYSASVSVFEVLNVAAWLKGEAIPIVAETPSILTDDWQAKYAEYAALGISALSIGAKEALFRYSLAAGKEANSAAVVANAWQHRSDAIISLAVFAGLIGSMAGYPVLDPAAGVLVAGVIIKQAYVIAADSLKDLSDAPAGAIETELLRKTCTAVKGVIAVAQLRARKSGPFLFVEVTINVDGNISASAAHRIAQLTRLALMSEHDGRVANAIVHVKPLGSSGLGEQYPAWARDHDFIVSEVKRSVLPLHEITHVSEVQVYYRDNGLISVKVDIVLPANLTIQEAHGVAVKARKAIEAVLPGIADIDVDLELEEELVQPR